LRRKIGEIIWIPRFTRYIFLTFILLVTLSYLWRSHSLESLRAAFYAWLDGIRGVVGRRRY
jgi:hypothetical protein